MLTDPKVELVMMGVSQPFLLFTNGLKDQSMVVDSHMYPQLWVLTELDIKKRLSIELYTVLAIGQGA
jgi:hypothetical protein